MSGLAIVAAVGAVVLLALLAVLQVCVAAGLPWGRLVWGGQHDVLPTRLRVGSALSLLLYAGFAAVLLSRAGVLAGSDSSFVTIGSWVLVAYFALGIVVNLASRSSAERWTMAPTCAVLAGASLIVALA